MEAGGEGGHAGAERGRDGGGAGHQVQAHPDPRHRDRGQAGEASLGRSSGSVKVSARPRGKSVKILTQLLSGPILQHLPVTKSATLLTNWTSLSIWTARKRRTNKR